MKIYFADDEKTSEIHRNFMAQLANNKARIRELRRYATAGFAEVFKRVPVLLNINEPGQPGYVDDPATPCGIKLIERQQWLPRAERNRERGAEPAARPVVESLFLIGSSGSVGHNASSDLDYWVCYNSASFSRQEFSLFQRKLEDISQWARLEHGTEANFYTVNLKDLLKGRLTRLDDAETEGEVAPMLLLEELYRTFLFVAGRPPMWQGVPLTTDAKRYQAISRALTSRPDAEFVDLGFPCLPEPQEMLAAALWLARKSEADPFKGILKIVALSDYVESNFTRQLLCDQVKAEVLAAGPDSLPVDPYVITINRVVAYAQKNLPAEQLDLLRVSAALKVIGSGAGSPFYELPADSPKRKALENWARQWDWAEGRMHQLADYAQWPEREQMLLGEELQGMLTNVYIRIAQHLIRHFPGRINPQDEELAPLAARLLTRSGGLEATVESLPSSLHRSSLSRDLILRRDPESRVWDIHSVEGSILHPVRDNLIYSCRRAVRAAAWLVHNRVYEPGTRIYVRAAHDAGIHLDPGDLEQLLNSLTAAFPPFDLRHEDLETIWSPGGHGKILLALNFELPRDRKDLLTVDCILRTGWGEMRHYYLDVSRTGSSADKYLLITESLLTEGGAHPRPENLIFQAPDSFEMRKAIMNIRGGLSARSRRSRLGHENKVRLDI